MTLIRRLRGPEGCPWDRAQTSRSLAPFLLEEAYELVDAITHEDDQSIREELGDILLHIVFQAELARERGAFCLDDVIAQIVAKISARHAHLLDGQEPEPAATWETRKLREQGRTSIMEGVPRSLPALLRAWRCQQRAAEVGFDWPTAAARWAKVLEELRELEEAVERDDLDETAAELGDLLFALVAYGRHLNLVAEEALHGAVTRFSGRFAKMEGLLAERGTRLSVARLSDMEEAWKEVKDRERSAVEDCRGGPSAQ
ncbi:MAG: nucleoside triphosphate pyrophosphohydrolase [Candidatus Eisenbacteria bacterium]|nr:nucleoside triphosphate pyrophosphohydrolase [Candidatus Eisenbacteria bacterium]